MPEATKKTKIKIIDMDSPQTGGDVAAPKEKKAKKAPKEKVDTATAMKRKLANTLPENRVDLSDEEAAKKAPAKKENVIEAKIDLTEDKQAATKRFATSLREKFNSVMSRSKEEIEKEVSEIKQEKEIEKPEAKEAKEKGIVEAEAPVLEAKEPKSKKIDIQNLEAPEAVASAEAKPAPEKHKIPLKLYRNIVIFFFAGVAIILSVIFYFSSIKATIVIKPKAERISNNLLFKVVDASFGTGADASAVSGVVESTFLEKEKSYPATGEKIIGTDAVGRVNIRNNYVKDQPLVATTRLLTADGQLYRIKDTVTVPTGGSVEVDIYADKPSQASYVKQGAKLTIPGLWAGIQDKIYAENISDIKYAEVAERYIQQSDIDSAIDDLKRVIEAAAKEQIQSLYSDYNRLVYKINDDSIEKTIENKAGDKANEFMAKVKAEIIIAAFKDEQPIKLAKEKMQANIPLNKEFMDFDAASLLYKLDNVDMDSKTADISTAFEGMVVASQNFQMIDKNKILGLKDAQLKSFLSGVNDIESYEIFYSPSWYKRVPNLSDRIKIEIVK